MLRPKSGTFRRACLRALLALIVLSTTSSLSAIAAPPNIAWVDWYAKTPSSVLGRLILGDEQIDVTFTGDYYQAFLDTLPEPYWGPAATYKNPAVGNAPPNSDVIVIAGGTPAPFRLSFSRGLTDPILAIGSLGLMNEDSSVRLVGLMDFEQSFEVLSNGPNYYAGGRYSLFVPINNTLSGTESSGTIRVTGSQEFIQWKSLVREETEAGVLVGTYIFTLGASCDSYRIGPTPLTTATSVPGGCTAFNDRSFQQQAQLDVRGTLDNRGIGSWVQGAALNVAQGGLFENRGPFTVGEAQTLTVDGTLRNFGALDVRGTLRIRAQESFNAGGTITLKGDNAGTAGGTLKIDAGARLQSTGSILLEGNSRMQVGGVVDSLFVFKVDSLAMVEVLGDGRLALLGPTTFTGGLLNQGLVSVGSGGELVFDRFVTFANAPMLLDNRGTLHVESGGTLKITADRSDPNLAPFTRVKNALGGTMLIDGKLQLDGQLENAGIVRIGSGGEMIASGQGASFVQIARGVLESAGHMRAEPQGTLQLGGQSTVTGVLETVAGGHLEVLLGGTLEVVRGGTLVNAGTFTNRGTVLLGGPANPNEFQFIHTSSGSIENHGLLRIGPGATMSISGNTDNRGRFVVDGRLLFEGESQGMLQSASGVLVNNGVIESTGELLIFGGRVAGNGTFQVRRVEIPILELAPPPNVSPGQSPGTLTFTGDLILSPGATVTMEFMEQGGGDRLVVGGRFEGRGATMKLVFLGDGTPGLDQIFDFLETPGGLPSDLTVEGPAGVRLDTFERVAGGRSVLGVAFAPPDATRLSASEVDGNFFNPFGVSRYVEDAIQRPGDHVIWNAGVIGIRAGGSSMLEIGTFRNQEGASLLNSGSFAVRTLFLNEGLVKNRAGATFVNSGQLDNHVVARFENRGTLRNEGSGRIVNRGEFVVVGELQDHTDGPASYAEPTILNDGGRFEILGSVSGRGSYAQQGGNAVTLVDGVLQADSIVIEQGLLTGAGRIVGPLTVRSGARIEPGNGLGTLTVAGMLHLDGGDILIEIAGPDAHDRIVVTEDATLDGMIRFRLLGDYVPAPGTSLTWLQVLNGGLFMPGTPRWTLEASDPQGSRYALADADGLHDPFGLFPANTIATFDGYALAFSTAPVPEPRIYVTLLAGLALVVLATIRRRPTNITAV